MKRLLRAPVAKAAGFYGALLAWLSPEKHQRYVRRRIRGRYKGPVVEKLLAITRELGRSQDQQRAMEESIAAIREGLDRGDFDEWLNQSVTHDAKTTLVSCADFLPGRSWKLQLFHIPEGHSHPPHSHSDVTSCLVVARGTVHAREYDRFHDAEDDPAHVCLSLVSDRRLARGDALLTTRSSNDIHWFGAVEGPAVAMNFQAVGFVRGRGALESRRVYVDPTGIAGAGRHKAPKLKRNEAERRFGQQPLSAFPLKS